MNVQVTINGEVKTFELHTRSMGEWVVYEVGQERYGLVPFGFMYSPNGEVKIPPHITGEQRALFWEIAKVALGDYIVPLDND